MTTTLKALEALVPIKAARQPCSALILDGPHGSTGMRVNFLDSPTLLANINRDNSWEVISGAQVATVIGRFFHSETHEWAPLANGLPRVSPGQEADPHSISRESLEVLSASFFNSAKRDGRHFFSPQDADRTIWLSVPLGADSTHPDDVARNPSKTRQRLKVWKDKRRGYEPPWTWGLLAHNGTSLSRPRPNFYGSANEAIKKATLYAVEMNLLPLHDIWPTSFMAIHVDWHSTPGVTGITIHFSDGSFYGIAKTRKTFIAKVSCRLYKWKGETQPLPVEHLHRALAIMLDHPPHSIQDRVEGHPGTATLEHVLELSPTP